MSLGKRVGGFRKIQFSKSTGFARVNYSLFFDRNAVMSRLDRKELRLLRRTGGFGRQFIRRSMRSGGKKGKQSLAGQPPRYHRRGPGSLKDGIFFQFDLDRGSVIVFANRLTTSVKPAGMSSGAELQEFGGRATITTFRHNKDRPGTRKRRTGRWEARPFVRPALKPTGKRMRELAKEIDL